MYCAECYPCASEDIRKLTLKNQILILFQHILKNEIKREAPKKREEGRKDFEFLFLLFFTYILYIYYIMDYT